MSSRLTLSEDPVSRSVSLLGLKATELISFSCASTCWLGEVYESFRVSQLKPECEHRSLRSKGRSSHHQLPVIASRRKYILFCCVPRDILGQR